MSNPTSDLTEWNGDALVPHVMPPAEPIDMLEQIADAVAEHLKWSNRQIAATGDIAVRVARTASQATDHVARLLAWAEAYATLTGSGDALDSDIQAARAFLARNK